MDEGSRAQAWRQRIMGLSIKELSELTGYSVTAIRCFEANANTAGELFGEAAWQRYRMACAGALAELQTHQTLGWGTSPPQRRYFNWEVEDRLDRK